MKRFRGTFGNMSVLKVLLWCLFLSLGLWVLISSVSTGLQLVYGQGSGDKKFFVFDGHMHPTRASYSKGGNMGEPDFDPQFTLPLARQGGLGAGFFNVIIDEFYEANHLAVKETLRQFDDFYRQIGLYPDQIAMATNAREVRALHQQGKIAAILGIEGGIAPEGDLAVLRMFHRLGLRQMNLVHWRESNIGDVSPSTKNNGKGSGLTAYGRELVAEMNRLGILIDLSHAGEQTVLDVLEVSTQPVANTHTGVRALMYSPTLSNWTDEMIQKLAKTGGVVCVPLIGVYLSQEYHNKYHAGRPRASAIMGLEPLLYTGDPSKIYDFIEERTKGESSGRARMISRIGNDLPPLSDLIDHIDYIVRLVGVDYVGIGSDFGGYPVNLIGMENAGDYQNVAQALLQRGYSEVDVAKIMGENLLRVFDQVVRTATD